MKELAPENLQFPILCAESIRWGREGRFTRMIGSGEISWSRVSSPVPCASRLAILLPNIPSPIFRRPVAIAAEDDAFFLIVLPSSFTSLRREPQFARI